MAIKELALAAITSITQSDFVRAVTAAGASRRITVANLAKAIVENYTGSSLAGKSQSVKAALDSLNSKTALPITHIATGDAKTVIAETEVGYHVYSFVTSLLNLPSSRGGFCAVFYIGAFNYKKAVFFEAGGTGVYVGTYNMATGVLTWETI